MTDNLHRFEYKLVRSKNNRITQEGEDKVLEVENQLEFAEELDKFLDQYRSDKQ